MKSHHFFLFGARGTGKTTHLDYLFSDNDYSYLKTEAGVEIDLILVKPNKEIVLIEIKSTTEIMQDNIKHLVEIGRDLKGSKSYLLSNDKISRNIEGINCLYWKDGIKEILDL